MNTSRALKLAFLATVFLCAVAYFLEFHYQLNPCPLCLIQRGLFIVIGIFLLLAIVNARFMRTYLQSIVFFSTIGLITAIRQIWLQHLPMQETTGCAAGIDTLLKLYSPFEALKMFFESTTSCHQVDFRLLHLSLAEWSGIGFLGCILFAMTILYRNRNTAPKN